MKRFLDLTPEEVREALGGNPRPGKLDRINFLVTPKEKREIQVTAKMFGLSVTDYFLRLHRLTVSMTRPRRRRRAN